MARRDTAETIERREKADALLNQWYKDNGLEICVEKNGGKDRDYLRWRVQKLGLKLPSSTLSKVRITAAKKKAETHKREGTVNGQNAHREVPQNKVNRVRVPDRLTEMETLALGLRKRA